MTNSIHININGKNIVIDDDGVHTKGKTYTKYKQLGIHFSKHEYDMICTIAKEENRTLINTIKTAIEYYHKGKTYEKQRNKHQN